MGIPTGLFGFFFFSPLEELEAQGRPLLSAALGLKDAQCAQCLATSRPSNAVYLDLCGAKVCFSFSAIF